MTFKNFLIVASKLDKAGINITTQLSQYGDFKYYLVDKDITHTQDKEDLEKFSQFDFIIFASKHQSKEGRKTLSIHIPGNFRSDSQLPTHGGLPGKVSKTSALFLKQSFIKLKKNVDLHKLNDYTLTLECTHHGPSIDIPCMFIEIGSTINEWEDRRAGFVIAKTISDIINEYKHNPYHEVAVGLGGPHYCPSFNKLQLDSNFAISHIISEYNFPLTEEMLKEAISKTYEEVDLILLDWKGLGNAQSRADVKKILDKLYLRYEKTSDVNKKS
ncbi:hypothetical protein COU57_00070 [Candidatus Pacearchaeota archaeon CG10_big_fil_rev_8_21_14_0_10_32_14]|nr:MAG: hypothetical protein COU57_00070 [Candidatus Pacearchaeota archaeon CG10_big_fil_rev_8_21_14_0_10_32_14]